MQRNAKPDRPRYTRRQFVRGTIAAATVPLLATRWVAGAEAPLAFTADGKEFRFDTGVLRGVLRSQGRSLGLTPLTDVATGATVAKGYGVCSHYRLLDANARYGGGAWDWASQARALRDGAVESLWSADPSHPFDLKAVYRWAAPGTLDVVTSVTAQKDLLRFEVFLASYFEGFASSSAYVQACPETGGRPGFLEATKDVAVWHMFPRDEQAVRTIDDGRWKRPPNPVDWTIRPRLAGALALRRDAASGLAALLMAPPGDCFAIAMPFGEEGHRSVYLSLLGGDIKSGQTATARTRLVIARSLTDDAAIEQYQAYIKGP
jgi:hypothetical protein